MRILLTGGTGLIGRALIDKLSDHQVTVLTRNTSHAKRLLPATTSIIDNIDSLAHLNDFDAVINLAGEPIVDKRWSEQQKGIICASRWGITEKLVAKIHASSTPPHTFISGSAVGYYGDQQEHPFDESLTATSQDFAHQVCANWEKIAQRASSVDTRVCLLRTGIVLSQAGGALKKMLLPYRLGLGGPIGDGRQYFPWIHIEDVAAAIQFLLEHPEAKGPFNMCSPEPVTNKAFSTALASALHRPHFLFTPVFAIKLMLGEAGHLLLDSQRAQPKALLDAGYQFRYPALEPALADIVVR